MTEHNEMQGQTTLLPVDTEAIVRRAVANLEEKSQAQQKATHERQQAAAEYQQALERHFLATISRPDDEPELDAA